MPGVPKAIRDCSRENEAGSREIGRKSATGPSIRPSSQPRQPIQSTQSIQSIQFNQTNPDPLLSPVSVPPGQPRKWSPEQVCVWLRVNNLHNQFADFIRDNDINGEVLFDLEESHLIIEDLPRGANIHVKKFFRRIQDLAEMQHSEFEQ